MTRITILGPGKVGTAVARTALRAGHEVTLAGPREAEDISMLVGIMAPGAHVDTAREAVEGSDFVILTLPIRKYRSLDPLVMAGRVVVDAMNYWPPTDGELADFSDPSTGTSKVVANHLHGSEVVKTLNHIRYHELESDGRPPGAADRRALAVASDSPDAAALVASVVESMASTQSPCFR
jgi:predicted dinucleotide-binding enzyme